MGAVAGLQGGRIVIGLIGDEALKAVPVDVGERELGARVRALAADDQARPLRPGVQRDVAGQLGHPGALARVPVGVDRQQPRHLGRGEDRLAHPGIDGVAEREAHARLAACVGERVAGAGGIRAREDRPVKRLQQELLERELEHLKMVIGVVGTGVAGPQNRRRRLPAAGHQQRIEAEPALVVTGRALLVRMGRDRRRVEVENHLRGRRASRRARALACARAARRRSSSASPTDNSTRRAVETDATSPNSAGCEPNATRSDTQRPPSASITARSQNNPPRVVRRAALARLAERPPQRVGQPQPLGRQRRRRCAASTRAPRRPPGLLPSDCWNVPSPSRCAS